MPELPLITNEYQISFLILICICLAAGLLVLPLTSFMTRKERFSLACAYCTVFLLEWSVAHIAFATELVPFIYTSYLRFFYLAWIPYFFLSVHYHHGHVYWNIVVSTMLMTASLIFHTLTFSLLMRIIPPDTYGLYYPYHAILWLICFGAFAPTIVHYLRKLFAIGRFDSSGDFWRNTAPLSIAIISECLSINLLNSGIEIYGMLLVPRLLLLLALVFYSGAFLNFLKLFSSVVSAESEHKELETQIASIDDYLSAAKKTTGKLHAFLQARDSYFASLTAAVHKHDQKLAQKLITDIGITINKSKLPQYCGNTICNAAITTYAARAKDEEIDFLSSLNLPSEIYMDAELSVVIANLLENAIIASKEQPPEKRKISLVAVRQGDSNWVNLLLRNKFDGEVCFDYDGYPRSQRAGHGLGTRSLQRFIKSNGGSVLFEQIDGWFSVYLHFYCGKPLQT